MQLALGIDPEPLSMAPFVVATHDAAAGARADFGVDVAPAGAGVRVPLARRLRRRRHRRRHARDRADARPAAAAVHRRRHQQRDRARLRRARARDRGARPGPAFEAAQIRCGMRAADGAIEGVRIDDGELALEVIGDVEPVGMCGSGLVDARRRARPRRAARPLRALHPRRGGGELRARRSPQRLTQDRRGARVRAALARRGSRRPRSSSRSATCASCSSRRRRSRPAGTILLRELGVDAEEITQVLLAGSFGAYLTPLSAIRIGLVPRLAAAADRVGRQRRRRGREDRGAVAARARRGRSRSCARSSTSSCPGARTSTTCSSTSSRSPDDREPGSRVGVIACGALAAATCARSPRRRGWDDRRRTRSTRCCTTGPSGSRRRSASCSARARATTALAVAYGDCGTYGALDDGSARRRARLAGEHCYEMFAARRCATRSPRSPARTS